MTNPNTALQRLVFLFTTLFTTGAFASAEKAADTASSPMVVTNKYVHHWIELPPLDGKAIATGEPTVVKSEKGRPTVLIFLASWCLPCQKLTRSFEALRLKYEKRNTRFVYVFTHDTRPDAVAFAKHHKLGGEKILASREALKAYHEPELPTIYVGDRAGWLVERYVNVSSDGLKDLDGFLAKHTSF